MKVKLLLISKTTDKHLSALLEEYKQRLTHYLSYDIDIIPDLKQTKNLSQQEQKLLEGKEIIKRIADNDLVILLDEHGKEMRSIEFASYMEKHMNASRNICFVIGGPYGFSEEVYRRANGMLSLSKMTFSHQMVRVIFEEQLYRAMTILKGEQYHHE